MVIVSKKKMKLKWVKLNALPLKSNEQTKISQTVNYLNLIIKPFNNDNNNNIKMSRAVFFMTINENVSTVWVALYEITLYYFIRQVWVMSVSLLFALPFIFSLCLTRICVMAIFSNSHRFHSWGFFKMWAGLVNWHEWQLYTHKKKYHQKKIATWNSRNSLPPHSRPMMMIKKR